MGQTTVTDEFAAITRAGSIKPPNKVCKSRYKKHMHITSKIRDGNRAGQVFGYLDPPRPAPLTHNRSLQFGSDLPRHVMTKFIKILLT